MQWEMWLLLVLSLPFVLYSLAKDRLGRMKESTQDEPVG